MSKAIGSPLAAQAMVYARSAVREMQPVAARTGGQATRFNLERVLHGMNNADPLTRARAVVALQEFMSAPSTAARMFPESQRARPGVSGRVRELVTMGDYPTAATLAAYIDKFLATGYEMDLGYESIFQIHDQATAESQLRRDGFKVLNIKSGVTFKKRTPGEQAQFQPISGSETFVSYDMWGGGITIDGVWWDDQDYLSIAEAMQLFRAAAYGERSKAFYGLITSLSAGINFSTGADLIAKINGACAKILRAVFGKGYDAPATTEFSLLYGPENAGLVDAAMSLTTDYATQAAAGKQRLQYRFMKIPSTYVSAVDGVYVILPKRQLKGGYRMDLTLYGEWNVAGYQQDLAGFHRFGGIVGDSAQVARIP